MGIGKCAAWQINKYYQVSSEVEDMVMMCVVDKSESVPACQKAKGKRQKV